MDHYGAKSKLRLVGVYYCLVIVYIDLAAYNIISNQLGCGILVLCTTVSSCATACW